MLIFFTDTGSLIYETERDDNYKDFFWDKNLLVFSDFPHDSKFFDIFNKKVIGKMKDKFKGRTVSEFVRLKSKMYSLIAVDGREIKKFR